MSRSMFTHHLWRWWSGLQTSWIKPGTTPGTSELHCRWLWPQFPFVLSVCMAQQSLGYPFWVDNDLSLSFERNSIEGDNLSHIHRLRVLDLKEFLIIWVLLTELSECRLPLYSQFSTNSPWKVSRVWTIFLLCQNLKFLKFYYFPKIICFLAWKRLNL